MSFDEFDKFLGQRRRTTTSMASPTTDSSSTPKPPISGTPTVPPSNSAETSPSGPPSVEAPASKQPTGKWRRPAVPARPTILIVDDDESILSSLTTVLGSIYAVRAANSAERALELLDNSIRVAILDVRMSGQDGFSLCNQIRTQYPHLPIIFHSAYQNAKDPYAVMNEHRPYAYLRKDGDVRRLMTVVAEAVMLYAELLEALGFSASLRNSK